MKVNLEREGRRRAYLRELAPYALVKFERELLLGGDVLHVVDYAVRES